MNGWLVIRVSLDEVVRRFLVRGFNDLYRDLVAGAINYADKPRLANRSTSGPFLVPSVAHLGTLTPPIGIVGLVNLKRAR